MSNLKEQIPPPLNLEELNAKVRRWQKKHDTSAKVAALQRKAILKHVVQSKAFAGQAVSMARSRFS